MISLLCVSYAYAEAPKDPWVEILNAQLERHIAELKLTDAPPIYHLRYQLLSLTQVDAVASLGSLVSSSRAPYNALGVEVRIGDPSYDNTGFGGWQNGFDRVQLPETLTPLALSLDAWRVTDGAYKQAVEQFARKKAQFVAPTDWPGDYTLTGPVRFDGGSAVADLDAQPLADLAVRLSEALRAEGDGPSTLVRGEVYVGHEAGALWTVDNEGSEVRTPVEETTIRALVQVRAPDGMLLTDQRLYTVRSPRDLPAPERMLEELKATRQSLVALADARPLEDEYVGPVVFEDGAAADLFRYILVTQLEGTPPEIPFDSWFGDLGDDRDPVRLGRRVLPIGWTVDDDPNGRAELPGSTTHDQEGTPSQKVRLVEDGIVRTVAMSRVPRKGVDGTNGHARGFVGQRAIGRVTQLTVTPDRHRSSAKLQKLGLKLARSYGRDWIFVVRRLQEPSVFTLESDHWFDEHATPLPPPVELVRRFADGREERVRGASFAGVQRWVLRDILAAGPQQSSVYMAPLVGGYGGLAPTEGIASFASAPSILVGELELVPAAGDPHDVPVLPPPPVSLR